MLKEIPIEEEIEKIIGFDNPIKIFFVTKKGELYFCTGELEVEKISLESEIKKIIPYSEGFILVTEDGGFYFYGKDGVGTFLDEGETADTPKLLDIHIFGHDEIFDKIFHLFSKTIDLSLSMGEESPLYGSEQQRIERFGALSWLFLLNKNNPGFNACWKSASECISGKINDEGMLALEGVLGEDSDDLRKKIIDDEDAIKKLIIGMIKSNPGIFGLKTREEFIRSIKANLLFANFIKDIKQAEEESKGNEFGKLMSNLLSGEHSLVEFFNFFRDHSLEEFIEGENERIREINEEIELYGSDSNEAKLENDEEDTEDEIEEEGEEEDYEPEPGVTMDESLPSEKIKEIEVDDKFVEGLQERINCLMQILYEVLPIYEIAEILPPGLFYPNFIDELSFDPYANEGQGLRDMQVSTLVVRVFLNNLNSLVKLRKYVIENCEEDEVLMEDAKLMGKLIKDLAEEIKKQYASNDYMDFIYILFKITKNLPNIDFPGESFKELEGMEEFFKETRSSSRGQTFFSAIAFDFKLIECMKQIKRIFENIKAVKENPGEHVVIDEKNNPLFRKF